MPDYTPNETAATFRGAVEQPERSKTTVTIDMPTDLLDWFRGGTQPGNWQGHMVDVLRFYVDTAQINEADAEAAARAGECEPAQP